MDKDEKRTREISRVLVGARRNATALPGFPGALPASLGEAYGVQHVSRAAWPGTVAGWKVGGIPPQHADALGSRHLAGPIFAADVVHAKSGHYAAMPVFDGGFAAIEPEFVIALGAGRDEDRMFIGAEIASSPLPAINDIGPLAVVCDFGNNNGLLLGAEIEGWRSRTPRTATVTAYVGGETVGTRTLSDFAGEAQDALAFLLDHARREGIDLPIGTLVSTGAITGVHEAGVGAKSELDFGKFGRLELELVPAVPLR